MIKTTETEFYKKIDDNLSVGVRTPIEGYEMNENVACTDCKYYKYHNEFGEWEYWEECKHEKNTHYTYDYKGKHTNRIWSPKQKNKRLDCGLWEEKISIFRKIKIRLGI